MVADSRISIQSLADIDYYPEITEPKVEVPLLGANFLELCEKIQVGL